MFSVKCILKEYPLRALIIIFCLLLFVFGHAIKITESPLALVEHPVAMDFTKYLNCFWCIIVTMGTIGYGDYYPRTIPGRIVIFLTSICGVLLTSLLIVALSAYLNMKT
jgi:voltage-gated potassium channel